MNRPPVQQVMIGVDPHNLMGFGGVTGAAAPNRPFALPRAVVEAAMQLDRDLRNHGPLRSILLNLSVAMAVLHLSELLRMHGLAEGIAITGIFCRWPRLVPGVIAGAAVALHGFAIAEEAAEGSGAVQEAAVALMGPPSAPLRVLYRMSQSLWDWPTARYYPPSIPLLPVVVLPAAVLCTYLIGHNITRRLFLSNIAITTAIIVAFDLVLSALQLTMGGEGSSDAALSLTIGSRCFLLSIAAASVSTRLEMALFLGDLTAPASRSLTQFVSVATSGLRFFGGCLPMRRLMAAGYLKEMADDLSTGVAAHCDQQKLSPSAKAQLVEQCKTRVEGEAVGYAASGYLRQIIDDISRLAHRTLYSGLLATIPHIGLAAVMLAAARARPIDMAAASMAVAIRLQLFPFAREFARIAPRTGQLVFPVPAIMGLRRVLYPRRVPLPDRLQRLLSPVQSLADVFAVPAMLSHTISCDCVFEHILLYAARDSTTGKLNIGSLDGQPGTHQAMLYVHWAQVNGSHPRAFMRNMAASPHFLPCISLALEACAVFAEQPPGPAPFPQRRLPFRTWPTHLPDDEVMHGVLPVSGLLLEVARHCLDVNRLALQGIHPAADAIFAAEVQAPLIEVIAAQFHCLCTGVICHESIQGAAAVQGMRPLPPMSFQPAPPNAPPGAFNVNVEAITVNENLGLNMRGVAASLIGTVLDRAANAAKAPPLPPVAAGQSKPGIHWDLSSLNTAAAAGPTGTTTAGMAEFLRELLFVTARRRFSRTLTNRYYAGTMHALRALTDLLLKLEGPSSSTSPPSFLQMPMATVGDIDKPLLHPELRAGEVAKAAARYQPYDKSMPVRMLLAELWDSESVALLTETSSLCPTALADAIGLMPTLLSTASTVSPFERQYRHQALMNLFIIAARLFEGTQQITCQQLAALATPPAKGWMAAEVDSLRRTMTANIQTIAAILTTVHRACSSPKEMAERHIFGAQVVGAALATKMLGIAGPARDALLPSCITHNGRITAATGAAATTDLGMPVWGVLDPYVFLTAARVVDVFRNSVGRPQQQQQPVPPAAGGAAAQLQAARQWVLGFGSGRLPPFTGWENRPLGTLALRHLPTAAEIAADPDERVPTSRSDPVLTALDIHRIAIWQALTEPHSPGFQPIARLALASACRGILLALQHISERVEAAVLARGGFALDMAAPRDDVCVICLEPMDHTTKRAAPLFLSRREQKALANMHLAAPTGSANDVEGTLDDATSSSLPPYRLHQNTVLLEGAVPLPPHVGPLLHVAQACPNPTARLQRCRHAFHLYCILDHMTRSDNAEAPTCPQCRTPVVDPPPQPQQPPQQQQPVL